MENDLISRSALWTDIMMLPHNGEIIDSDEVERCIANAPAVDAELVRYGQWMPYYEPMEYFVDVYLNTEIKDVQVGWICSECGRHEQHSTTEEMPYCHCGAKMDAEV